MTPTTPGTSVSFFVISGRWGDPIGVGGSEMGSRRRGKPDRYGGGAVEAFRFSDQLDDEPPPPRRRMAGKRSGAVQGAGSSWKVVRRGWTAS